jgi:hypothetical protein
MTTNDDFSVRLGEWLNADSAARVPAHLDVVLLRTAATKQRRWWSSPGRWLPVHLTVTRLWAFRPASLRTILVLGLVALVIAALVAVVIGSRRPLPPPFGVARNGALVSSANGDLYTIDPKTGNGTPLIVDPNFDFSPIFSRDGTKLAFLHQADPVISAAGLELAVANADGSGARVITPAFQAIDSFDWSPDGTRIVFLTRDLNRGVINVVHVDGSGLAALDVGRPTNQLSWLPPNGTEILFRGEHLLDRDPPPAIYAVHPDGSGLRTISTRQPRDRNDFNDVSVSPDGTRVAYRGVAPDEPFTVHVLSLATGDDRTLPAPGGASQGGPGFSPDGSSIVYLRWYSDSSTQLVVAPADGSGGGIAIGPHGPFGQDGPSINNYGFAPDGTAVFANYDAEKLARLLPVDGSPGVVITRGKLALVTYQRLAP